MKKNLLVICLVFCCVWGAMAQQKLRDAVKKGDLNTVKNQIELLDLNVKESSLLDYTVECWEEFAAKNVAGVNVNNQQNVYYYSKNFYEQSNIYKEMIEYFAGKGATLSDNTVIKRIAPNEHSGGVNLVILEYLLNKKIINLNRMIKDGNRTVSIGNFYYECLDDQVIVAAMTHSFFGIPWKAKFLLISQYFSIPSNWDPQFWVIDDLVKILRSDLDGIKESIRQGHAIDSEAQLFINDKRIADLLKATDNYKLGNYTGFITPYYVGTIIPKYCTQCLTQDDIALIKLIADYDSSKPRDVALAKVKTYIANGVDINKGLPALGGATIANLPETIGKLGDNSILDEVLSEIREKQRIEEDRIAAEKAEQERIAREKAEAEKKEKEKIAEETLMKEFLPQFESQVREALVAISKKKKGKYQIKSSWTSYITKSSLKNGIKIKNDYQFFATITPSGVSYPLCYFDLNQCKYTEGCTVEIVEKVLLKAIDNVAPEFGL